MPDSRRSRSAVPLLFLIADTGGGHRAAATAVAQALQLRYPGMFAPILCDPLGGPHSAWALRRTTGWYGPLIRYVPWLYGAAWHACNSRLAMRLLWATALAPASRSISAAVHQHRPAAIVSFHPLLGRPAVLARGDGSSPVLTVITDLVSPHRSFRYGKVDRIVAPSAVVADRCRADGFPVERCAEIGVPVGDAFCRPQPTPSERAVLRRRLGLRAEKFVVLLTGGGEGSGGIVTQSTALLDQFHDIDIVAICGRNRPAESALRRRATNRLIVRGFVDNMADWLRAADVVVTKAGPTTIAEAACCGTPLLITSYVPGQERGNVDYVVASGAGRYTPDVQTLLREIAAMQDDPGGMSQMRSAATRIARPRAAIQVAELVADLIHHQGA